MAVCSIPGIEAVGLHADRDIEIKTDLHAEFARKIAAGPQLPVRRPLHEFDEFNLGDVRSLTQFGTLGLIWAAAIAPAIPTRAC